MFRLAEVRIDLICYDRRLALFDGLIETAQRIRLCLARLVQLVHDQVGTVDPSCGRIL